MRPRIDHNTKAKVGKPYTEVKTERSRATNHRSADITYKAYPRMETKFGFKIRQINYNLTNLAS
jgi:hypothetical protein